MIEETPQRFVVVGNPDSRRVVLFQEALARAGLPPAHLVAYADLLAGRASLAAHLSSGAIVRIESPGKSFEVERALIALGAGAMEEKKASITGKPFDVRVVTIAGLAAHFVVRIGNSPMTNLHLGNPRGDAAALLDAIGPEAWEEAKTVCERAAAVFPASLYAGVDLLIAPPQKPKPKAQARRASTARARHAILEINAFGDLLPGVLHAGLDTYGAEIEAVLRGARPV